MSYVVLSIFSFLVIFLTFRSFKSFWIQNINLTFCFKILWWYQWYRLIWVFQIRRSTSQWDLDYLSNFFLNWYYRYLFTSANTLCVKYCFKKEKIHLTHIFLNLWSTCKQILSHFYDTKFIVSFLHFLRFSRAFKS